MRTLITYTAAVVALCTAFDASAETTREDLKALRAQRKAACQANASCKAGTERKAAARRDKQASRLREEIGMFSR